MCSWLLNLVQVFLAQESCKKFTCATSADEPSNNLPFPAPVLNSKKQEKR